MDCIATDHAPHARDEKAQPMEKAPFGIVGSETAFPLLYLSIFSTSQWWIHFINGIVTRNIIFC
jgi:dihydroorotase